MNAEQQKALVKVIEECGEVVQAYAKGLRFGWDNHHPDVDPIYTNFDHLEDELQDVVDAIRVFFHYG